MTRFRLMLLGTALAALTAPAFASQCVGTGQVKTCIDDTGNTYTVQKFGSQTFVQGSNARTGARWSQNSTAIGGTTFTQGRDQRGRTWNRPRRL